MRDFRKQKHKTFFRNNDRQMSDRTPLKYSQNFLTSTSLIADVLTKVPDEVFSTVIDIGAGKGIITEVLSRWYKKVIAYEIDNKLVPELKTKFQNNPTVHIVNKDFRTATLPENESWSVFANIPFFLTADIIKKLVNTPNLPQNITLFVQQEAAKKFLGSPFGKETLQSLLIKPFYEGQIIYHCKKTDFLPVPLVQIVVMNLHLRAAPAIAKNDIPAYRDFIVFAITGWFKNIQHMLEKFVNYNKAKQIAHSAKVSMMAKPTDLDFDSWVRLFTIMSAQIPKLKEAVRGSEKVWQRQQQGLQKQHRSRTVRNKNSKFRT
jgi:23S rRNA (adenine-N6)-dimethyltransferase